MRWLTDEILQGPREPELSLPTAKVASREKIPGAARAEAARAERETLANVTTLVADG